MDWKAELVLDAKAALGEGPSWDAAQRRLLWVDILNHNVHIYDPAQGDRIISVGETVGAVVPRRSGGAVAALQHGIYGLDTASGKLELLAQAETELPQNRFNDGKCDPAGRFWVGTMDIDEGGNNTGALYTLDTELHLVKKAADIGTSNGLAWSPDQNTLYFIDTPTRQVSAFDYEPGSGSISNRRAVVALAESEGFPDGMTIDAEGMLWVAHWGGGKVSRWDPRNGERIGTVSVPAPNVTSCCFGGDYLDELYITTAQAGLSDEQLAEYPHAGGLFRVKPGVKGTETIPFAG